jgi:predicted aldo/keto reductase-like oxidoreductase
MENNRRSFIKSSLMAATVAPAVGAGIISNNSQETKTENKIVYRTLGKTGLKLPVISMGAGDTTNPKLVEAALNEGIKLLATSQYFYNGGNETMIGGVIKGRKRSDYLIATSAMPDGMDHKTGMFAADAKADEFVKKVEGSLQRLGIDYVDILFLPFAAKRESVFYEPYLRAMEKFKKDGKAKFIGIATHSWEHEAIRAAVDTKIYDIVMTAYNFRKANGAEIKDAVAYAAKAGLGIIAMKTMAGSFWDKERTKPINASAALKWVLQDENVHTIVPGFTTFDQLTHNMELMKNLTLTADDKNSLIAYTHQPADVYCQQCGQCVPQCTKSLDIPTIMRGFMYAYGYKNLHHAQQTLNLTGTASCNSCDVCNVNCSMGFDVKSKIADISRLKNVPEEFLVG